MKIDYSGKTVVITGGTAGIGLETAKAFCENGANVVICGRDVSKIEAAVSRLKQSGDPVAGFPCDATSRAQLFDLADKAAEAYGKPDIWINNAGHTGKCSLMRATEEFCENEVNLNFKSALWGAQAAFKYMSEKGGVIVNVTSLAAATPQVSMGLYAASKSALTSLTRTLASELSPYGIRVVGCAPGLILTPLLQESLNGSDEQKEAQLAMRAKTVSQHRIGRPEEVANLLLFLASDYADFISGTCVDISGGKLVTQNPDVAWDKDNAALYDPGFIPNRLRR